MCVASAGLVAISLCDLPACQWIKISVPSTMLNVLLANPGSRLEQTGAPFVLRGPHTNGDTPTPSWGITSALPWAIT